MKVKHYYLKPYKIYVLNNNFQRIYDNNNNLLYEIDDGFFKFHDKRTMIRFMKHGIKCQCQRKIISNKPHYYYFNNELSKQQIEFLQKRAQALEMTIESNQEVYINHDCGCKKDKARSK